MVGAGVPGEQAVVQIDAGAVCGIAYGVDSELEPGQVRRFHSL